MNQLFTGAAMLSVGAACWSQLRTVLSRAWSVVFVTLNAREAVAVAVKGHCWRHYRRSPFGQRVYTANMGWVRPLNRLQNVAFEMMGTDPIIFWKGWWPIMVGVGAINTNSGTQPDGSSCVITFIRGTFDADQLIRQAVDEYNTRFCISANGNMFLEHESKPSRFFIRRFTGTGGMQPLHTTEGGNSPKAAGGSSVQNFQYLLGTGEIRLVRWEDQEVGPALTVGRKALDALAFPAVVGEIVAELQRWFKSENWYREKMIPWTRGWLIHGLPGTGKTSLVRAVAQDNDLPVFIFDLASMSNREFVSCWEEIRSNTPCVALIEDVDAVFNKRENVVRTDGTGLTFDCLLNAMSGIEGCNGILKVLTTNNIHMLDDALGVPQVDSEGRVRSSRPGRADRVFELTSMTTECRQRLANRILADCPELIPATVISGNGDTPGPSSRIVAPSWLWMNTGGGRSWRPGLT